MTPARSLRDRTHKDRTYGAQPLAEAKEVNEPVAFVDKPHAAEMIGVSVRPLERLVATGQFPPPIQFGRRRRWLRKGLSRWIEGGCKPARQA